MIEGLANITFWLVVALGTVAFAVLLFALAKRDLRAADYPGGRNRRMLDKTMVIAPGFPGLVMLLSGSIWPVLRDQSWWFVVLFGLLALGAAASFSGPCRRARSRLASIYRYPSQ